MAPFDKPYTISRKAVENDAVR